MQEQGELFVLQADLINAYNLVNRQAMLAQVKEHFPELLPWVSTCYGSPSHLLFGDKVIASGTGLHQGDPLASLEFTLALYPVLLEIQRRVPNPATERLVPG